MYRRKIGKMKIKIRKKEKVGVDKEEPVAEDQPPYIQPREQLHNIIKVAEYATHQPVPLPEFKSWKKEETAIKQKHDIKEVEQLVDKLIERGGFKVKSQ